MIEEAKLLHMLVTKVINILKLDITLLSVGELINDDMPDDRYREFPHVGIYYSDIYRRCGIFFDLRFGSSRDVIEVSKLSNVYYNILDYYEDEFSYISSNSNRSKMVKNLLEMSDEEFELLIKLS